MCATAGARPPLRSTISHATQWKLFKATAAAALDSHDKSMRSFSFQVSPSPSPSQSSSSSSLIPISAGLVIYRLAGWLAGASKWRARSQPANQVRWQPKRESMGKERSRGRKEMRDRLAGQCRLLIRGLSKSTVGRRSSAGLLVLRKPYTSAGTCCCNSPCSCSPARPLAANWQSASGIV